MLDTSGAWLHVLHWKGGTCRGSMLQVISIIITTDEHMQGYEMQVHVWNTAMGCGYSRNTAWRLTHCLPQTLSHHHLHHHHQHLRVHHHHHHQSQTLRHPPHPPHFHH